MGMSIFFFQAEDGIRDIGVTGVQTCALPISASPVLAPVLSVVFAVVSAVGGILLALGGSIPISPFVTTISFVIYLVCRAVSARRVREIGRASCRERGEISVVAVSFKKK